MNELHQTLKHKKLKYLVSNIYDGLNFFDYKFENDEQEKYK